MWATHRRGLACERMCLARRCCTPARRAWRSWLRGWTGTHCAHLPTVSNFEAEQQQPVLQLHTETKKGSAARAGARTPDAHDVALRVLVHTGAVAGCGPDRDSPAARLAGARGAASQGRAVRREGSHVCSHREFQARGKMPAPRLASKPMLRPAGVFDLGCYQQKHENWAGDTRSDGP